MTRPAAGCVTRWPEVYKQRGWTMFKKATRTAVKLKIGLQGPSGSGKTLGALALAKALANGGKIAVIDTENGSASLYADKWDFDVLELDPPYTSRRYQDAIRAAMDAGYAVVVIDSLTHQWAGEGGILARKETSDARPGTNSFTNWAPFTKEHEQFKASILHAPVHVIATMRTKQEYALGENSKGKQVPKKMGMAPIQREGFEYEFSVAFELQMDHRATASKDRTGLFDGELVDLLDGSVGKRLLTWLSTAKPEEPKEPTITEGQWLELQSLANETADSRLALRTVLSHFGAKRGGDLPAKSFKEASAILARMRALSPTPNEDADVSQEELADIPL